jgi:hypothetical protein
MDRSVGRVPRGIVEAHHRAEGRLRVGPAHGVSGHTNLFESRTLIGRGRLSVLIILII